MPIRKLKKAIFDRKKYQIIAKDLTTLMMLPHQDKPLLKRLVNNLISELMRKEKDIEKLTIEVSNIYEELILLYQLSEDVISLINLDKILTTVISYAISQLNAEQGIIIFYNKEKKELEIKSCLGFKKGEVRGKKILQGNKFFLEAINTGKTIIGNNLKHTSDIIEGYNFNNILISPLKTKTMNIGCLCLFNKSGNFDSMDVKIGTILANQASISIEKALLYNDLQRLFLESVEALSSAIDAKDPYTHGHSHRVARFALLLADKIGVPLEKKRIIHLAGLLHDIGKIKVPIKLLHKKGLLKEDEFTEIKKHPIISAEIIKHIKKLEDTLPGVMYHHEHYSGNGYPDKLKGEEIPLEARILCIADSFDAMISERSYRKKMNVKQALRELYNYSGTQFDPNLVKAFISLSKVIKEYLEDTKVKDSLKKK